jgi:amino acid adenylation domain-containing protein
MEVSSNMPIRALGHPQNNPDWFKPTTQPFMPFDKAEIEGSISERFTRVVRQYPDQIAIKVGKKSLTYSELEQASNRLAQTILGQRGVNAEPIALVLEHGIGPIVALLAVLKAGKFYVALDPFLARPWLTDILDNLQPGLIVTNQKNVSLVEELAWKRFPLLDMDGIVPHVSDEKPNVLLSPDALAAIFYTSGSTGQPKGVLRNHRNLLHNAWKHPNICSTDRHSLMYSCSFAASEPGIFDTLLNGATLCPYNVREDGLGKLVQWLIQEEITILHPPVTLFRQFLDLLTGQEHFPKLRMIILGGQAVHKYDVERFKNQFPAHCLLVHRLALTEANKVARFFIDRHTAISGHFVPVGYAIDGKEIRIVDERGQEVGPNAVGEMMIRSRYLSPGYWRNLELTRQKFLPDPEGGDKHIYLTGDLGRMHPDGCLEHLGRKDYQVKIRGYRVELAKVETALYNLGVIKAVVVVANDDPVGDTRLIAYWVPALQPVPTVSELRQALVNTLPEYMIPSRFVIMESLPLTPTGKVDRQALPEPDQTRPVLETAFVAPRSDVERQLAQIWEQVLGIQPIGVRDNFFDLGGNSLVAGKMLVELNNALGTHLPLISLFQAPTIERLADTIQHKPATTPFFSLIPIQDQGALPPLFFLYPLGPAALDSSVQGTHALAVRLGNNQPLYGLRYGLAVTQDPFQLPSSPKQMDVLAAHYIQEIQQIQPKGPYFLCGRSGGGLVAFEMACQLHQQGHAIGLLVLLDTFHPSWSQYYRVSFKERLKHNIVTTLFSKHDGLVVRVKMTFSLYRKHNQGRLTVWGHLRALYEHRAYLLYKQRWRRHRHTYVPKVYPGKVILFEPEEQTNPREAHWGWERFVSGGVEIIKVPGRHGTMLEEEPNVSVMAEKLQMCLKRAQERLEMA